MGGRSVDESEPLTGTTGAVPIYMGGFFANHVIHRTMMRMDAWVAYIVPVRG